MVEDATPWFSAFLGGDYRLVAQPPVDGGAVRRLPGRGSPLAFVDGAPLHLLTEASLNDLWGRLGAAFSSPVFGEEVSSARFRPNLIIAGAKAFAEDAWKRLRIGSLALESLGPCARCALVNVDPQTGALADELRAEPLRTLAGYRRRGRKVHFGQNVLSTGEGTLHVGDPVEVLE